MTNFDLMRQRLEHRAGILPPVRKKDISRLRETEWDSSFEQLMRNRMVMGAIRYESFRKKKKGDYNYIRSVEEKIVKYKLTGNTELLVDIANYMMIMFTYDGHPNHHFSATDDEHHCQKL